VARQQIKGIGRRDKIREARSKLVGEVMEGWMSKRE